MTPDCQTGFGQPSLTRGMELFPVLTVVAIPQLDTWLPLLTMQPLLPPLPPTVSTKLCSACSSSELLL